MKPLVAPLCLAFSLIFSSIAAPQPALNLLGPPDAVDLGLVCETSGTTTVCWGSHVPRPDLERYDALLTLTAKMFKYDVYPPVSIYILPYAEFELRGILKFPTMGRQIVREGTLLGAYIEPDFANNSLRIETFNLPSDKILIHEFLHALLVDLSERGIANTHDVLNPLLQVVITSYQYKEWLRQWKNPASAHSESTPPHPAPTP